MRYNTIKDLFCNFCVTAQVPER